MDDAGDGDVGCWGITVSALRSLLRAKDVPSSGNRKDLVQRLIEEGEDTEDENDYEGMTAAGLKDLIQERVQLWSKPQKLPLSGT